MIRKFLALFEGDWRKNIKLSWYESDKYDCEMSLICKWQKANEYENLLNFANEKLTQKYFELKHPLHNDISTRAVYSWHNGGVSNFVFMIDKEEKYPWLFVQIFRFINVFISLEGAFIVYEDLKGYAVDAVYRCSLHFKDELLPLLHYKDTEFALELANARPAHYYGMLLVHICNMRSEIFKKSINDNKIFFIPHEFEGKKSKGLPAIQPTLFPIIDKNKNFNALRGGGLPYVLGSFIKQNLSKLRGLLDMSEQMRQLAKLFENWVANFKIIEYKCQNTSEIDKIYTAQKNFDFKSLATFWSEKCQNECFEMNHPLHQEIKTKAVASFYDGGIYNFVLMMDENERYPWLIIQYTHCINAFVVPNYCYVLYEAWQGSMFGAMSFLRKQILQNKDELCFKDVEFGFILSNARPAHYFCHILAPLVSLDTKEKTFCTKNSFFFPKKPKSKEKLAFFYPTCLWNYNLTRVYDVVALQSLQDLNTLVSNEDKIDKFDTSELSSLQIINSKNLELSL